MPANPHIQRLVDEGYTIEFIDEKYILVENVPYVSASREICRAAVISVYHEKDGVAHIGNHDVWFTGSIPCTERGESLESVMVAGNKPQLVAGRQAIHLSYKSERPETLSDIYNKLTHYIRKLQGYANAIDPTASARSNGSVSTRQAPSVFLYPNLAIAREGLDGYENKLKLPRVAIVGLGGSGSYILDVLAKTPVGEIHLYDGDTVDPAVGHRVPGAMSIEDVYSGAKKTDYLRDVYGRMRTGIESHPYPITEGNVHELDGNNFVFIAVDHGPSRAIVARHLAQRGIPFVDVGMGIDKITEDTKLIGRVRITSIGDASRARVEELPVADDEDDAVYNNIQIAELNALNAMIAVIVFKQKIGFYAEELPVSALRYVIAWQRLLHSPAVNE